MSFAENTTVAPEKSRAEIESLLKKYGASAFAYGHDGNLSFLKFRVRQYTVSMRMALPLPGDAKFTHRTRNGWKEKRSDIQATQAYEQELRRLWRSMALLVKAKLEAVASNISTIEREFLADIVLDSGQTVQEALQPQMLALEKGRPMPPMLLGPGGSA